MSRHLARLALALLPLTLAGCGGVFDSKQPAPQTYVLRLPAATVPAAERRLDSLRVQRPDAGPGLDTDRIALLRSDRRLDFYAAARWAAPTPDLLESAVVDTLRATGAFVAVFDDAAPFAPRYDLRITLRRFEADYTGGGQAPVVHVVLDFTLARFRDRALLASFSAQGSAPADTDRMSAVVKAFEIASTQAMQEVTRVVIASAGNDRTPSEGR